MCGRATQPFRLEVLARLRALRGLDAAIDDDLLDHLSETYRPTHNLAPTQHALLIHAGENGRPTLDLAHFGLIPSWAGDRSIASKMINARCETIADKPAFRGLIRSKRAALPIGGFYEWQKLADGKSTSGAKRPWYIRRCDDEPMLLACVWDTWLDNEHGGSPVDTFAIITTESNERLADIHHRMPVVLEAESLPAWFDRRTPMEEVHAMLRPAADGVLDMHPVSTRVNSPANNDPALIEPCDGSPEPDSAGSPPTLWG